MVLHINKNPAVRIVRKELSNEEAYIIGHVTASIWDRTNVKPTPDEVFIIVNYVEGGNPILDTDGFAVPLLPIELVSDIVNSVQKIQKPKPWWDRFADQNVGINLLPMNELYEGPLNNKPIEPPIYEPISYADYEELYDEELDSQSDVEYENFKPDDIIIQEVD